MMEREKNDILYLVVPCYNEQEVLPETSKRLKEKMESLMAVSYTHLTLPTTMPV